MHDELMPSAAQAHLVRETWSQVAPDADEALQLFYGRLFELDPALRRLFCDTHLPTQRQRLRDALHFVVQHLERPAALRETLLELGARHAGYGARPEHYRMVTEALLWTLDEGLGALDDASRVAWMSVLDWVATQMLAGASARATTV